MRSCTAMETDATARTLLPAAALMAATELEAAAAHPGPTNCSTVTWSVGSHEACSPVACSAFQTRPRQADCSPSRRN